MTDSENSMAWPIHFARDWKIVVLVFAAALIFLSFFSWKIYLSDKIGGGYFASELVTTDISVKTIDKNRLQADLLLLETKQADFLKLKATQSKPVDSSL